MKIQKLTPRGYCHGVVEAINWIVNLDTDLYPKPIYILGMLVHNKKINESLALKGISILHDETKTRLELLDMVDHGTVIFTAHGVSKKVYDKAINKGLEVIDTTCTDVNHSFDVIKEKVKSGYDVLYIGKNGHPESEAACAIDDSVHLITTPDDIDQVSFNNNKIAITNQTTMSIYDVYSIHQKALERFPNIEIIEEICDATKTRQEAVKNQDDDVDLCIVVGDFLSNNTKKLKEVSLAANIPSIIIESISDLDVNILKGKSKVSITSGASTASKITKQVIDYIEAYDENNPNTHQKPDVISVNNLLPKK